jgi:type IV pilus assembly protein PilY1
MQLFFDAFRISEGATVGKPIVIPPVLSVDHRGHITINFATGDQDLSGSAGVNQYVYSLTEVDDTSSGKFAAQVNWATRLEDGEHVVGPLSLLDGAVYFTTVAPAAQNACDSAPASIWGVDYLQPADPGDVYSGGVARLQPASEPAPQQSFLVADLVDPSAGTQTNVGQVFGVSLEYVPSCATIATATDQFTGASRSTIGSSAPPPLQLVFQTSGNTAQTGLGFNTSFQAVNLVQSRTASTIQSWAAVLE